MRPRSLTFGVWDAPPTLFVISLLESVPSSHDASIHLDYKANTMIFMRELVINFEARLPGHADSVSPDIWLDSDALEVPDVGTVEHHEESTATHKSIDLGEEVAVQIDVAESAAEDLATEDGSGSGTDRRRGHILQQILNWGPLAWRGRSKVDPTAMYRISEFSRIVMSVPPTRSPPVFEGRCPTNPYEKSKPLPVTIYHVPRAVIFQQRVASGWVEMIHSTSQRQTWTVGIAYNTWNMAKWLGKQGKYLSHWAVYIQPVNTPRVRSISFRIAMARTHS
jgi:hypothetical protein